MKPVVLLLACIVASAAEVRFRHSVVDPRAGTGGVDINAYGDINGDGLADIVEAAKGGEVIWYENPSLKRHDIYKASFKWSCEAEIADMDGDKDNDIVLVSWYESKHYWLENPGQGGEWKLHLIGGGIMGHDVEAADLDGDGRLEVVVRSETWPRAKASAKEIQIWRSEGPDRWTKSMVMTTEGGGIKAADVDRDRDLDIIAGGRWYENDGKAAGWTEHVFDEKATTYNKIEFADINGDYRNDIVLTPSEMHASFKERGPVVWYESPADAKRDRWTKHVVAEDMGDLHTLAIADFDLDGNRDIFTAQMRKPEGTHHEVLLYLNQGRGATWTKQVVSTSGTHQGGAFDLGGDGDYDLAGVNQKTNTVDLWENLSKSPGAKQFTLFDGVVTYTGKRRLWENWDFVTKLPIHPGAPQNWLAPVNFADGKLKFEVEVLEMSPVDLPVSVHMGWWNLDDDPEIRHTAGAPILFNKPGTYATIVPVRAIRAFYGAGPRENAIVKDWNWHSAYARGRFYTFIQPKENPPTKDGFPYKMRATVTVYAKGEEP